MTPFGSLRKSVFWQIFFHRSRNSLKRHLQSSVLNKILMRSIPARTQLPSSNIILLLMVWVSFPMYIYDLFTFRLNMIFNLWEEMVEIMTWEHRFVWMKSNCATDMLYNLVWIVYSCCLYLLISSKMSYIPGLLWDRFYSCDADVIMKHFTFWFLMYVFCSIEFIFGMKIIK